MGIRNEKTIISLPYFFGGLKKLKWLRHLRNGLRKGYPLCCIIAFCLGAEACKVGIVFKDKNKDNPFVPCIFHRRGPNYYSYRDALCLLNDGVLPLPESNFTPNGFIRQEKKKGKKKRERS